MKALIFLTVLLFFSAAQAGSLPSPEGVNGRAHEPRIGIISTHDAIESMSLRISIDNSLHGFVEGKVCDSCETIKVIITPETRAYAHGREVPLKKARSRIGRFATVIFERDTKKVSAIRW